MFILKKILDCCNCKNLYLRNAILWVYQPMHAKFSTRKDFYLWKCSTSSDKLKMFFQIFVFERDTGQFIWEIIAYELYNFH